MANISDGTFKNSIQQNLMEFMNKELKYDKEVDSWMFMSTPWPILIILTVYLLFVLKIGPKIMKNRRPFNIKYIMMSYNLMQIVYNMYIVIWYIKEPDSIKFLLYNVCHTNEIEDRSLIRKVFYVQTWHYFISKMFDLMDTIFFILRKKQSHVSFLHVYHHTDMVITTWSFLRFIKVKQGIVCVLINASIHCIMYSYYFLSLFGPQMKKYLCWKKYLTSLQIIQFIVLFIYGVFFFIHGCELPRIYAIFKLLDLVLFFYLFRKFYVEEYTVPKKEQ